ncbi:hypothetical protein CK203_058121 [Vitis vinifera]|uniref:Uncharacterized protein n=1 Tax=Vitis vinifera TaxID=29760 RepID=A0A438FZE0_VITVI|nr:hypothetical protein CK203_058121 [Vitis vinifera]
MGIRNLSILNMMLLANWRWRFAFERESLWKRVIVGKFGEEGEGWSSGVSREGMGGESSFGYKWCGDTLLKVPFPTLFAIANSKDALVVDMWEQDGDLCRWHPSFSRQFHDWEVEMVEASLWKPKNIQGLPNQSCLKLVGPIEVGFFLSWVTMGDALLSQDDVAKLEWGRLS